ncbi:hypothetical protein HAX54_046921, partial [Datura stramonium]|nr:hypothetical protein [Datura stramonium]
MKRTRWQLWICNLTGRAVVQFLHSVLEVPGWEEVKSTSLVYDWKILLKTSRALQTRVMKFCVVDRVLYRRSYMGPLARCLSPGDTTYVLREIHERVCENYFRDGSLVHMVVLVG